MRLFATLSKIEEQDDGSIKVFGVASTGARDDAGEIILPQAMKDALPDYMKWGAIREMHQPSAAGTALEAYVDEDGFTQITAHVVDPIAIQKVRTKTYKGFSVGGKVLARDPNDRTIITAIKLIETSLVDRPCNPEAEINMWKAADIADPEGADMSNYQPTNDEVKAHAGELAKAAGKPDRANDYLVKAREELVARGAPAAADPTAIAPETLAVPAVVAEAIDPAAALGKALEAAQAVVAPPVSSPVTPGLAELGKGIAKLGELYAEDPLAKGFWSFSCLADAVQTLVDIQACATHEAGHSKAEMQSPQMLAEAAQAAGQAMMQYVKEVLANAMANMQAGGAELQVVIVDGDEAIALAAAAVDMVKADTALMEKAGKRNSAEDQKNIQAAHDSMVKAGAKCSGDAAKGDETGDLAKMTAERDRFADALVKAVPAVEALTANLAEVKARLEKVEAQPMPSKTAGSSLASVDRVADTGGATPLNEHDVQKALDAMPEAERAHLIMKAALARPIAIQA